MSMGFKYIVWHTAADATKKGIARDTTAAQIHSWHLKKKWRKGGYQRVVRFDGRLDGNSTNTRTYSESGAHVEGANSIMIGYCFSGHGDFQALTREQILTGLRITKEDMLRYEIPVKNVIGHNEVNRIITRDGLIGVSPVNKSCPGRLVNMETIRGYVSEGFPLLQGLTSPELISDTVTRVLYADKKPTNTSVIKTVSSVQSLLKELKFYDGKIDGWAGKGTSDAVKGLFGFYLFGDPRANL